MRRRPSWRCWRRVSRPGDRRALRPTATWADVIAAAKKEGKVVFYTSFFGRPAHLDIIKTFEAKYGIQRRTARRARQRDDRADPHRADLKALSCGDVQQNGAASLVRSARRQHPAHGAIPNAKTSAQAHQAERLRRADLSLGYGILINTSAVKGADVPKILEGHQRPEVEGQDHLRRSARAGRRQRDVLRRPGQARRRLQRPQLSQQAPVLSRDVGNDERRVARGEYPMRIPQLFSNWPALKSLPVKFIAPEEPALHPLRLRRADRRAASECCTSVHQPLS